MAELLERARQVQLRLVYFGPSRSGKAANLQRIHELLPADRRSRMKAFDAGPERTISFEIRLPVELEAKPEGEDPQREPWTLMVHVAGCSSPLQKPTKVALLESADAIALVADGIRERREENHEAFREAEDLIRNRRRAPGGAPPVVLQVNKRDRLDALTEEEIEEEWSERPWPIFTSAAKQGEGVRETFTCLLRLAFESADRSLEITKRTGLTLDAITSAALSAFRRDAGKDELGEPQP